MNFESDAARIGTKENPRTVGIIDLVEGWPLFFYVLASAAVIAAVAIFVIKNEIDRRYEAEIHHHVDALRDQIRFVIKTSGGDQLKTVELLKNLVREGRWDYYGPGTKGYGYFFLYEGSVCRANGGFPDMEGKDFELFKGEEAYKKVAIQGLQKAANDSREPTVSYKWPKPGENPKELFDKIGYATKLLSKEDAYYSKYEVWWIGSGLYKDATIIAWSRAALWFLAALTLIYSIGYWLLRKHLSAVILDLVPEAILITGSDNKIEFANRKALHLFGYSKQEMLALPNVFPLIPPTLREDFKQQLRDVDAGERVQKYHAARLGKGDNQLRVHSRIVPLSRGRRMHAIYDVTKQYQFDMLLAGNEAQHTYEGANRTLLCVQINFEELAAKKDPEPSLELFRDYLEKADQAVNRFRGMRVELPPPWKRTQLAFIFKDEANSRSACLAAALELLRSLIEWRNSNKAEGLERLTAQIYLRQCFVAVTNEKAPSPAIAHGKEVARNLDDLDLCPFNKVTVSGQLYRAAKEEGALQETEPGWALFKVQENSLVLKIGDAGDDLSDGAVRATQLEVVQDRTAIPQKERFAVALSFPGEKRPYVESVAAELVKRFGKDRILYYYDDHISFETSRPGGDLHLLDLYKKHSELIVVFLCPEYTKKQWCLLEWKHIQNLARNSAERVMYLSLGHPGDLSPIGFVHGNDIYKDVAEISPEIVAAEIQARHAEILRNGLKRSTGAGD